MAKKQARLTANCDRCGEFTVTRTRKKKKASDGCPARDLPMSVVCPGCTMWAEVTKVEALQG